jgi:hypothetical protein
MRSSHGGVGALVRHQTHHGDGQNRKGFRTEVHFSRSKRGSTGCDADYRLARRGSSHRAVVAGLPSLRARHHNRDVLGHPLQALIDRPVPDLALPASNGSEFRFRQFVGQRPLALFFYLLNGTPG